jgi:hypothetical protein
MGGERVRIWIDEDVNMRYIDYFQLCNFRGLEYGEFMVIENTGRRFGLEFLKEESGKTEESK